MSQRARIALSSQPSAARKPLRTRSVEETPATAMLAGEPKAPHAVAGRGGGSRACSTLPAWSSKASWPAGVASRFGARSGSGWKANVDERSVVRIPSCAGLTRRRSSSLSPATTEEGGKPAAVVAGAGELRHSPLSPASAPKTMAEIPPCASATAAARAGDLAARADIGWGVGFRARLQESKPRAVCNGYFAEREG